MSKYWLMMPRPQTVRAALCRPAARARMQDTSAVFGSAAP